MLLRRACLFLVVALVPTLLIAAPPQTIHGRVVSISDGDTITILDASRVQHRVRLAGIDAPEKSQPFGTASRRNLGDLLFGEEADVVVTKTDRYERQVGKVFVGNRDVCLEQLRAGMAWLYTDYAGELSPADRISYAAAEREARASRRGLWGESAPVPPWQFRRTAHTIVVPFDDPPATPLRPSDIVGNRNSRIYHLPGCPDRGKVSAQNRRIFSSEKQAIAAGYRKARNCD